MHEGALQLQADQAMLDLPTPGVLRMANRNDRRMLVNRKAICCRCGQRLTDPADVLWDTEQAAHGTCANKRNHEIGLMAERIAYDSYITRLLETRLRPVELGLR